MKFQLLILLITGALTLTSRSAVGDEKSEQLEHFEKKIRPLFVEHCYSCHSADAKTIHGGLRLDTAEALLEGGDSGPPIVEHVPDQSLLIQAVLYDEDAVQMPPIGKLSDSELADLIKWVEDGAAYPPTINKNQTTADKMKSTRVDSSDIENGRNFWSFQPLAQQPVPPVADSQWPRQRIDFFLLDEMQKHNLKHSTEADKPTLLRRLSLDLTGLPPAPEQISDFVSDNSDDAYNKQVERLLQSPQYGERWARMWLDLARYTDKTASWLDGTGQAHLYRDWVVKAFNDDMPYPDFVRRQLATDLMDSTGPDDVPALGFLGLSPSYWKELKLPTEVIKVIVADEWEERIDAVSRTFLGLTVACARCHDHKFDPITTEDYYALAGVIASCRISERPTIADDLFQTVKAARERVSTLQNKIGELEKESPVPQEQINELKSQIASTKSATPQFDAPMANGVVEESLHIVRAGDHPQDGTRLEYKKEHRDLHVFIRGNPNRLGDLIPRRFLSVLSNTSKPFTSGSGRLELANAIVNDAGPLAARVIVNRIWLAHFGRGLVNTPSNFGQQGERPTHPELLDDLSAGFVNNNWSIKWLHRQIVLSAAYRQSSRSDTAAVAANVEHDPENRLLWRMNRRRMQFEAWRDAMLSVSGTLNLSVGGPSQELDNADNVRRSIYCTVHRRDMSTTLLTHDFPDPTSHSPQRLPTTTALQGLYALNGPLLENQAGKLAERLILESPDNTSRIDRAYQLLFSRAPSPTEIQLGRSFVSDISPVGNITSDDNHATGKAPPTWQQYCHVLLLSNEFLFID